jgi:hypothetical protein
MEHLLPPLESSREGGVTNVNYLVLEYVIKEYINITEPRIPGLDTKWKLLRGLISLESHSGALKKLTEGALLHYY